MASVSLEEGARVRGALLGLAVGDTLGASYEFESAPLLPRELVLAGGGPWRLAAGEWTDDTSMALCLAESLVARAGFDAHDQMERYCRWYLDGNLSSKPAGHPRPAFDVGNTVRAALERYTTAAVVGQLAGAHLGADAIPHAWRTGIAHRELVEGLAQDLQQRAPA